MAEKTFATLLLGLLTMGRESSAVVVCTSAKQRATVQRYIFSQLSTEANFTITPNRVVLCHPVQGGPHDHTTNTVHMGVVDQWDVAGVDKEARVFALFSKERRPECSQDVCKMLDNATFLAID